MRKLIALLLNFPKLLRPLQFNRESCYIITDVLFRNELPKSTRLLQRSNHIVSTETVCAPLIPIRTYTLRFPYQYIFLSASLTYFTSSKTYSRAKRITVLAFQFTHFPLLAETLLHLVTHFLTHLIGHSLVLTLTYYLLLTL